MGEPTPRPFASTVCSWIAGPAALAVAILLAGCGPSATPSSPAGSTSQLPSQSVLGARDLADAKRFRRDYGLRSDDSWIRQVAADPASAAGKAKYGIPLTSPEVADLDSRTTALEAIKQIVAEYGRTHEDAFAGAWIDQQHGGVLVAQFSRNVDQHRAALLSRMSPIAPFEVKAVRWSLEELNAQLARLQGDDAWFRSIPAVLMSYGVDEPTNQIFVRISSVNPAATRLIEDRYGWHGSVAVESDGTGALLLPTGSLVVTATDGQGRPVSGLR